MAGYHWWKSHMTNIWSHCARYNVNAQWTNEERCESDRCGSTVLQDLATHNVALQLRSKASLHQNNQYLCETSCWLTMNDAVAKCYCKPPFAMPTSWSPLHAVTQQLPNRSQSLKTQLYHHEHLLLMSTTRNGRA